MLLVGPHVRMFGLLMVAVFTQVSVVFVNMAVMIFSVHRIAHDFANDHEQNEYLNEVMTKKIRITFM